MWCFKNRSDFVKQCEGFQVDSGICNSQAVQLFRLVRRLVSHVLRKAIVLQPSTHCIYGDPSSFVKIYIKGLVFSGVFMRCSRLA